MGVYTDSGQNVLFSGKYGSTEFVQVRIKVVQRVIMVCFCLAQFLRWWTADCGGIWVGFFPLLFPV